MTDWNSKFFTEKEFLRSETLPSNIWDNEKHRLNAIYFCKNVLDIIRKELNYPIVITSGYRNQKLNKMVGGVINSAHCYGLAVDTIPLNKTITIRQFHKDIHSILIKLNIPFDQLIYEKINNIEWVHLGISYSQARKEVFDIIK